jgi:hypothetical protein
MVAALKKSGCRYFRRQLLTRVVRYVLRCCSRSMIVTDDVEQYLPMKEILPVPNEARLKVQLPGEISLPLLGAYTWSVCQRFLYLFDDKSFHRTSCGFQPQAELLLYCGKKRCGGCVRRRGCYVSTKLSFIGSPLQVEVASLAVEEPGVGLPPTAVLSRGTAHDPSEGFTEGRCLRAHVLC